MELRSQISLFTLCKYIASFSEGGQRNSVPTCRKSHDVSSPPYANFFQVETTLNSTLILADARPNQSGNYTCQPAGAVGAHIQVFVSEGESTSLCGNKFAYLAFFLFQIACPSLCSAPTPKSPPPPPPPRRPTPPPPPPPPPTSSTSSPQGWHPPPQSSPNGPPCPSCQSSP